MPVVIRAVFDGKTARPLPGEPVPPIEGEVEVEIVLPQFAADDAAVDPAAALFRIRSETPILPFPVSELVQASRDNETRSD